MLFAKRALSVSRRQLAIIVVACLGACLSSGSRASEGAEDARMFIEGLAGQAIAALTPPGLSRNDREARARILLKDNFAVPAIAQFVLGRYWPTATPEERNEYLKLFEDLIVVTYVDRFVRYSGERLEVTGATSDKDSGDVLVSSQITRTAAQPISVGWRVRKYGPAFKIIDVYVEGVSMGQTQRSEFSSVIRNNGGSVTALLDEMRRRVQQQT